MPRIELAAAELPLGQGLLAGQRYPLIGAGLSAWIAQSCAAGEARRALGVVQECREVDPAFLPDDPDHTAALVRLAARIGMPALDSHLAKALVERWPRHEAVTEISGLVANADPIT